MRENPLQNKTFEADKKIPAARNEQQDKLIKNIGKRIP